MDTKKYNSIDLCKFIMAFGVIAIHTHPLENCTSDVANNLLDSVVAMAVPFFFLSTGFLLAQKLQYPFYNDGNAKIIIKYIRRMLKLYLIWEIVYFPWAAIHFHSLNMTLTESVLDYLQGIIFVGELYNSWHLWYLLSTIYALLFFLFEIKRKRSDLAIIIIGCVFLLVSVGITYLVGYYEGEVPEILEIVKVVVANTIRSGRIFLGFFYIPVGMVLAKKDMNLRISWLMLIAGFAANYLITDVSLSTFVTAISAIGLFGVIRSIQFADLKIFPFVRKMSTITYFIHMYIWSVYYILVYREKRYGMDSFIVTSIACVLISAGYLLLKDRYTRIKQL